VLPFKAAGERDMLSNPQSSGPKLGSVKITKVVYGNTTVVISDVEIVPKH